MPAHEVTLNGYMGQQFARQSRLAVQAVIASAVLLAVGCSTSTFQECGLAAASRALIIDASEVNPSPESLWLFCVEENFQDLEVAGQELRADLPSGPSSPQASLTVRSVSENSETVWASTSEIAFDRVFPNGRECPGQYLYPPLTMRSDFTMTRA